MFRAAVSRIVGNKIYVRSANYGSIAEITGPTMARLAVNDNVLCDIIDGRKDDIVIVGKILDDISSITPVDYAYGEAFRFSETGELSLSGPGAGEVTNAIAPLETAGRSSYPAGSSIMRVDGASYWPTFVNGGVVHTHQYYYRTHQIFHLYSQTEPLIYHRQWWNTTGQWSPWTTYQKKFGDGVTASTGSTTGTIIGSASDKVGFFGTAPAVKQSATSDIGVTLSNLGLRNAGTAYPVTTSGAVSLTGQSLVTNLRHEVDLASANYTASINDHFIRMSVTTSSNRFVTLPAASSALGKQYVVQKTGDSSTGLVIVLGITMSPDSESVIDIPGDIIEFYSDGTNWYSNRAKPYTYPNLTWFSVAPGWTMGASSKHVSHPGKMAWVSLQFTRSSTNAIIPLANGVSTVTIGGFSSWPFLPAIGSHLHSSPPQLDIVANVVSGGDITVAAHHEAYTVVPGTYVTITGWITQE